MVRRSTWIVLAIFAVLVGVAIYYQRYQANKPSQSATGTPTALPVYLYNLGDSQITNILIADNSGKSLDLQRDNVSLTWTITGMPAKQADSTQIETLSSQLSALKVLDTLTDVSLATVGLDKPAYTITLTTSTGNQLVTLVGMQTAIGTGYYVKSSSGVVMIVDKSGLAGVLNALTAPPLLPTPTPKVTPTETVQPTLPTSQATPTP